jgi:hypothetical protein
VYGFIIKDGCYTRAPVEDPGWDVKLVLWPAYLFLRPDKSLARLTNAGKMMISYTPTGKGSKGLTVINNQGPCYFMTTKENAGMNIALKAVSEFKKDEDNLITPPAGSTIYIEVILADSAKQWVELLPGLSIKWGARTIVGFVITNPGGKLAVRSTNPAVETKLGEKIGQQWFYIEPKVGFLRLFYSMEPLSEDYLEKLTAYVKRLIARIPT